MTKIATTSKIQLSHQTLKTTVIYSYVLYAALVLSQATSVVNTFSLRPEWTDNDRIVALYVAMTGALLVPPLLAFLAGYFSTRKSKKPYLRQFSGAAAGLAGFMLSHALSTIAFRVAIPRPDFMPLQVHQFGHAIIATVVILIICIIYWAQKNKQLLLFYKPLSLVLIASVAGWFVYNLTGGPGGISAIVMEVSKSPIDMLNVLISIICIPIVFGLSYYLMPNNKLSAFNKITLTSMITATFLGTALAVDGLLMTAVYLEDNVRLAALGIIGSIISVVIWGFYMRTIRPQYIGK